MLSNVRLHPASAAIVAVVWGVSALMPGSAGRLVAQEGGQVSIFVDDPRPLQAVVLELERRFGWIITYEDPEYLFAPEIKDVRYTVSRDPKFERPVLIPAGGPFTFSYTLPPTGATASPQDALLGALLDQYRQSGYAGTFRLERTGLAYHVVPAMARDETGVLRPYGSILDRRISLPDREVNGFEMFASIVAAVKGSGEQRLVLGVVPISGLGQIRVRIAADDESARSVLVRTLASIHPRLSWQLLCGPGDGGSCALNIHEVLPVSR